MQGIPRAARCHPQVFVSLREPSGRQLDYPVLGVLRWFEMVAFLASASAITWRYQLAPFYYSDSLCFSLTRRATQRHRVDRLPVSAQEASTIDIKTPF